MMTVVKPIEFNPSMLLSTTAIETVAAWVTGTYSKGDEVLHPDSNGDSRIWESLIDNNTLEPSLDTAASWLDARPANKFAMFDSLVGTQTTAASTLVVELQAGDVISTLALLNLKGSSIQVEMIVDGAVVYDSGTELQGARISDWWEYYFLPDEQISQAVYSDLPLFYDATIRITLNAADGQDVAIGQVVFGTSQELGQLSFGAGSGIIDYSRKDVDEFGNTTFVRRDFADEFDGQVLVENSQLNRVKRLLRDLRATPALWIGCDKEKFTETLQVYGWYRQHRIVIAYPSHSLLDIEIEGLI